MPVEIELSPDKKKVILVRREDSRVTASFRFDPLSTNGQRGAAVKAGITVDQLLQYLDVLSTTSQPQRFTLGPAVSDPADFIVREIEQTPEQGVGHRATAADFLMRVLPSVPLSHVATWESSETCCCLDVDYHDIKSPERVLLESAVYTRMAPKPFAWHFSRGGGLHLFYIAAKGFTAEELAAVAALRFRMIDPTAGVELKRVIRGPGEEKVIFSGEQDTTGTLLEWLREPEGTTDTLEEWLEEEGLEIGKRYDHDKCPLNPTEDGGKHRSPVVVREHGIQCYVCEGKELRWGSRRPGFFPWSTLLGQPSAGDVGIMVRKLCHWGHAKWVLQEKYGLNEGLARKAYAAALKAYHDGKPTQALVEGCFDTTLLDYTLVGTDWLNLRDQKPFTRALQDAIKGMPAVQYVDAKGQIKSDPLRVNYLIQSMSAKDYGFPPISLIFGIKMAAEYQPLPYKTVVARPNPSLLINENTKPLPRYVPFAHRMPLDKARSVIEQIVPRTDWNLIQCILCGIGTAQETELGLPPRLFVAGPTRAAKSAHFQIAAAIAGVRTGEAVIQGNEERLRQAIMSASESGPIVLINEIFKDAYRNNHKQKPVEALQPILSLTKDSMTHVLYKGPRSFSRQFLLGFTEVQLPTSLRDETQIARRMLYHRLEREKRDWPKTIVAAGVSDLHLLRLASPEVAEACNAILSDVVDHFFITPMTFQEQARQLGIVAIEESNDQLDRAEYYKLFFKLVCEAPPIENERLAKMYPGFIQIQNGGDGNLTDSAAELLATYTELADAPVGKEWYSSQKLSEKDWGYVLGVEDSPTIALLASGTSVFVRFQVGPLKKPVKINREIVDPTDWKPIP